MQRKTSWGLGRGHCPSPEIFFSILSMKMATFSAFWVLAHAARGAMAPPGPPGSASDTVWMFSTLLLFSILQANIHMYLRLKQNLAKISWKCGNNTLLVIKMLLKLFKSIMIWQSYYSVLKIICQCFFSEPPYSSTTTQQPADSSQSGPKTARKSYCTQWLWRRGEVRKSPVKSTGRAPVCAWGSKSLRSWMNMQFSTLL